MPRSSQCSPGAGREALHERHVHVADQLCDVLERRRAPDHGVAARQLLECHVASLSIIDGRRSMGRRRRIRQRTVGARASATIQRPDSVHRMTRQAARADADAVRDGARLGARVPRHDGRDRGAAAAWRRTSGSASAGQQWVYLAYALSLSAFYLVGGAIGDRVGLRRTFVVGVVLFAVASLLTALAPSEGVLIGGRALQGVGGAVLTTTSLALLRVTWAGRGGPRDRPLDVADEPRHRGRAAARRRDRAGGLLALGLPDQRAARGRHGRARARRTRGGRARRRAARRSISSARRSSPSRSSGSATRSSRCASAGSRQVLPFLVVGIVALDRPRRLDAAGARSGGAAVAPARARPRGREPRHARHVRGARRAPAVPARLPAVPRLLADARGPRLRAAEHRADPARAALRPLRRPQRPAAPDRVRRGDDRRRGAAAAAGHRPAATRGRGGWRASASSRSGLSAVVAPITAAALSPAPEDLAGVAAGLNQTVARVGGILSGRGDRRARRRALRRSAAARATRRSTRQPSGAVRAAGVDAFHGVVLSVAGLAFLASVLAADRSLRGHRQSRTPSSVSSATLRSSPPA